MTDRLELLADVHAAGLKLRLADRDLVAKPVTRLSPELHERLKAAKPKLLSLLARLRQQCPDCGGEVVLDRTHDGFDNRFCMNCGAWHTCQRSSPELIPSASKGS